MLCVNRSLQACLSDIFTVDSSHCLRRDARDRSVLWNKPWTVEWRLVLWGSLTDTDVYTLSVKGDCLVSGRKKESGRDMSVKRS